jgi:hypothetical protein
VNVGILAGGPAFRVLCEGWGTSIARDEIRVGPANRNQNGTTIPLMFTCLIRSIEPVSRRLRTGARKDPFWQAQYYDFNVWSERKRIEKLR